MKIISLVGARPQFIKEALLSAAVRETQAWSHVLVHSGQHYDPAMSGIFFEELGIPTPSHHLGIGSGSHAEMTAAALVATERVLLQERPDALLVYGDTNTTLAGALAAAKLGVPTIHVEAGIRQQPATMPEEINRILTDRLSAILCCCSELASDNLKREANPAVSTVTGDIMYDLFLRMRPRFTPDSLCQRHGVEPGRFLVSTVHRDFNTDTPAPLTGILTGLSRLTQDTGMPVLLPVHPRTRKNIAQFGLDTLAGPLRLLSPLGYLDLMSLVTASAGVVTDSGGLQKEAYYAQRRAVVVMPDTGWRELTACGWNILAAPDEDAILLAGRRMLEPHPYPQAVYGAGDAASRIVAVVTASLAGCRLPGHDKEL